MKICLKKIIFRFHSLHYKNGMGKTNEQLIVSMSQNPERKYFLVNCFPGTWRCSPSAWSTRERRGARRPPCTCHRTGTRDGACPLFPRRRHRRDPWPWGRSRCWYRPGAQFNRIIYDSSFGSKNREVFYYVSRTCLNFLNTYTIFTIKLHTFRQQATYITKIWNLVRNLIWG